MSLLTQPAFGPKLSISFITGGTLLDVWTLVWRFTVGGEELSPVGRFWFYGLLLTGVTFLVIGLLLGQIGRAARKAELPPTDETVRAEEHIQSNAVAVNPALANAMAANVGVAPIPQPILPQQAVPVTPSIQV